jgi:hypothetical protein
MSLAIWQKSNKLAGFASSPLELPVSGQHIGEIKP